MAEGRTPLAEDVRSAEILRADEPLFVAPAPNTARRGAAALGAHLPIYGAVAASGCRTEWLMVGARAWVCGDVVRISSEPPLGATETHTANADGMPRAYYFVGSDGALGYAALAAAGQDKPVAELQPGYAISISATGTGPAGDAFGLTTKGFWLPLADLRPARPSTFQGYEPRGALDRGWVVSDFAATYSEPGKRIRARTRARFDVVAILERREAHGRRWIRVADGEWLDATDVRVPRLAEPPAEARDGERWIDVDLENQVVTAYEGKTPVFTTLASTGTGKGREPTATPAGVHRIWVKLLTSDMDNLEDVDAQRYYAMLDVPWVLFFKNGAGLHGAFWHSSFGHVRSHGCVNLTPLDAERLFYWTSPRLPAGWTAALPTEYDPGTLVRVR
ncbi:MAG TPA: L,D-transpeptidase [Polyangiaceae bacterium]|nr:L,D-transpeptidase [Polyangiaceae bacterium]